MAGSGPQTVHRVRRDARRPIGMGHERAHRCGHTRRLAKMALTLPLALPTMAR